MGSLGEPRSCRGEEEKWRVVGGLQGHLLATLGRIRGGGDHWGPPLRFCADLGVCVLPPPAPAPVAQLRAVLGSPLCLQQRACFSGLS